MKTLEKNWKTLLVFIGIPLLLIIASYIYVRVGYKKPIFAVNYSSNKIANGTRYDGILFTTIYCKDGTNKVRTRFTNYTCSSDRIFTDGYYINDNDVKISKDFFDKYIQSDVFYDDDKFKQADTIYDIDEVTADEYEKISYFFEAIENGDLYSMSELNYKSEEGYGLLRNSETGTISCFLGLFRNGAYILGDYVDGKCILSENIADYVKDPNVTLVDTLKDKVVCSIND